MSASRHVTSLVGVLVAAACMAGCAEVYQVRVTTIPSLNDETVVSPALKERQYKQVMVLPPSGTARGVFEKQLVWAEGEFLKRNLGVTSPAVGARVVDENQGDEVVRRGGGEFSDMERALRLSKKANCDVVVQIGSFEWVENGAKRYFVGENEKMREVTRREHDEHVGFKYSISTYQLHFSGRLVEVEKGDTLATFNMAGSLFGHLPQDYVTTWQWDGAMSIPTGENYRWNDEEWIQVAMRKTSDDVFSRVADYIAGRNLSGGEPAAPQ
ncbi:MAG: hypothetical protein HY719_01840 [Planctomycetes bacterium]|nr:hypothetical protein [Planctomycetota bacterium]